MSRIHWSTVTLFVAAVAIAVASRLLPHPPNFTPIAALGLFAGAIGRRPLLAGSAVLAAMLVSDLVIGFHGLMLVVYGCLLVNIAIGSRFVRDGQHEGSSSLWSKTGRIAGGAVMGSLFFFLVTNFAHFLAFYPINFAGLVACYTAAIPFFQFTLAGDLCYSGLLFGAFAVSSYRWSAVSMPMPPAFAMAKK